MPDLTNKVVTHMTLYADDSSHNTPAYVYAKQFDAKSRFLVVKIMTAGGQITSWGTARLNAVRPDGTALYINGDRNEDGTITIEITQDLLAVVGETSCDITLYEPDNDNSEVLTTSTFRFIVDKSNYSADAIESTNRGMKENYYTKDEIDNTILPYIQSDEDGTFYPIRFVDRDEYEALENPEVVYHNVAVFLLEPQQTSNEGEG